jgi:glutaminyl-peptide cyclotransferase
MRNKIILVVIGLLIAAAIYKSCKPDVNADEEGETIPNASNVKPIPYSIIAQYPHDTATFTEGLEFFNGKLYESGGDYKNSVLRFGNAKTGVAEKINKMGTDSIFGEGITILNGKLYQLTYTTHQVFVYDINNITKPIKTLTWPNMQGWGMTNNGTDIILTTGDTDLYFVDPETFKIKSTVHIHDDNGPVKKVNELEYVDGFVWANIWETNDIIKIDPKSGAVVGKMNFNNLLPTNEIIGNGGEATMNGIAYDSNSKTFFLTGKRWPKMYELRVN